MKKILVILALGAIGAGVAAWAAPTPGGAGVSAWPAPTPGGAAGAQARRGAADAARSGQAR